MQESMELAELDRRMLRLSDGNRRMKQFNALLLVLRHAQRTG